jgi:opacity protein-like surface antigen
MISSQATGKGATRRVWRFARWVPVLLAGTLLAAPAFAGSSSVGVRYGWADASGELFKGSPDLGGCNLVGVHLGLDLLPLVQVEVAGEYVSQSFGFAEGLFEGIRATGKGDYEDLTLFVTGRVHVLSLFVLPVKGYVGGGANVHYADLKIKDATQVLDPGGLGGDLEDAIQKATGKTTRVGWHLVAGLRLAFTGFPASVFLEGRYQDPFKRDQGVPTTKSLYAGLSFSL